MTPDRRGATLRAFQPTLGHRYRGEVVVDASRVMPGQEQRFKDWIDTSVLTKMVPGDSSLRVQR